MQKCFVILLCIFVVSCRPAEKQTKTHSKPQRIVSLAPAITQKLFLLGVGDRVVANTVYCNKPEAANNKVRIGNVTHVNVELIVTLNPDLVIASNLTKPEQVEILKKLGIPVVRRPLATSFNKLCEDFIELGDIVGASEKAKDIVTKARADVKRISRMTIDLPKQSVFVQIGTKPLFTVTKDTFVNDFIEYAGGKNIASLESSGIYSREKVIEENPDVMIITTMGINGEAEKKIWLNYPAISAVTNNRIHVIDSYEICSPTPSGFPETLKDILFILHPELADK